MESNCRELIICHESKLISELDRWSVLASLNHNLINVVASIFSKTKPDIVHAHDYHPLRAKPASQTMTVDMLKARGEAWKAAGMKVGRRRKKKHAGISDQGQNHVQ